jgi:hypothetical protein
MVRPLAALVRGSKVPEGVVKTHFLTFANATGLMALATREDCTSSWVANPKVLAEWMGHFWSKKTAGTEEITFECGKEHCRIKSYEPQDMNEDGACMYDERAEFKLNALHSLTPIQAT